MINCNLFAMVYTNETLIDAGLTDTAQWNELGDWDDVTTGTIDFNIVSENAGFDNTSGLAVDLTDIAVATTGGYDTDPWYWVGGGGMLLTGFDTANMSYDIAIDDGDGSGITGTYDYFFRVVVNITTTTDSFVYRGANNAFSDDGAGTVVPLTVGTNPIGGNWGAGEGNAGDPMDQPLGGIPMPTLLILNIGCTIKHN